MGEIRGAILQEMLKPLRDQLVDAEGGAAGGDMPAEFPEAVGPFMMIHADFVHALAMRFHAVTTERIRRGGAVQFAWIRPGEFSEFVAAPHGAFAYKFEMG